MNAFDFAEQILSTPLITDSATLKKAQQGVMDYFAASLQARHQKVLQDFKAWINREGGKPVAWLIGQKAEVTVRQAALFNGFQAHLLDYDDVHSDIRGHPSAVILSALFATLSSEKSSLVNSQCFLTAYIIGVEVMARLGKAVNPAHYLKGWHSTATLGGIAATCAICYLYKKDSLAQAIALAATQASGMRMVFGSPIKALHAGMTAQSAIQAVEWLEAGLSLDQNAFDENIGFFVLMAEKNPYQTLLEKWGENWQIHQLWFKTYPYCSAAAGIADAAYQLREELDDPNEIKQILLFFHPNADAALIYRAVQKPSEGRFSAEYLVAAILLGKRLDFQHFEQAECEPDICKLMTKIDRLYQATPENKRAVTIVMRLKNGAVLQAQSDYPKGSPMKPYSDEELNQKLAQAINNEAIYRDFSQALSALPEGVEMNAFIQTYQSIL